MNYLDGNDCGNRSRPITALVVVIAICVMLIGGCNEKSAPAAPAAAVPIEQTWEFDSPEAALKQLQALTSGRDLISMYENMYARSDEEKWVKDRNREMAQARYDFAKIINVVFGQENAPVVDIDKDMKTLAAALSDATMEVHGESRRIVRYPETQAGPPVIILADIQGKWMIHVSSISGGEEIDMMWCAGNQRRYTHILDTYEKGKQGLRKGAYISPEDAQREIEAMLAQ